MARITNNHPNRGPAARKSKEIAKAIMAIYRRSGAMAAGNRFIDSEPGLLLVVQCGRVTGRIPAGQLTAHLTREEIQAVLDLAADCQDGRMVCLAITGLVITAADRRNGAMLRDEGGRLCIETVVDGLVARQYKGLDVACYY